MKDTIICDLDGTLANCEHRVHHVRDKPKNWDAFYKGVKDDGVNEVVDSILHCMLTPDDMGSVGHHIIFCSGRPERCRADTESWINRNTSFYVRKAPYTLLMRKDGDFRADYIVKQEILDTHIDKDRVLFCLDDRQQVVDMWRRNGLVCLQVAKGDF
jgi:hypothetical protein